MSEQRQKCIVNYQIATYSGEVTVYCDCNDENEYIIAKAKKQLRQRAGSFPYGCERFKIIEREDYNGE